jgi:PAS domain S-box-containing protein
LGRIVQAVTDVATELSGAEFGAFFYNVTDKSGESYLLYALSGAPREAFESLGPPRNTTLFEATFRGTGVIRSDDIRMDARYGENAPHCGMPKGHLPVVSYLAVPVGRLGKVHGGLFLGHPDAGVFTQEAEDIVAGIAAHAAIAIDNAQLYQAERRLASIVETSADAIVSKDLNGIVTSWNNGAERLFGYTTGEMVGKSITLLIPADRHNEETIILERVRRGERVEHYETVRKRKDGSQVDISLSVSPITDVDGRIIGASKIARDITEQKQAAARQELLAREIQHRTKNMFAVVNSIVARSFAGKATVEEAVTALLSRLHSLAQTHVMLIDKEWQGVDISEVVRAEMSPYMGRLTIEGPPIMLNAQAAQNFALALHELATNAAKYGALSNQAGQVSIVWSVFEPGRFKFRWEERGGPEVSLPKHKGFGSAVLEQIMAEYFETPPQIEFARAGVRYELSGPLEVIAG